MNLKLIAKNTNIATTEEITTAVKQLNLDPKFVELIFARGLRDSVSINKFLTPNKDNFYDPFLLKDMQKAVDRIRYAIDNSQRVVVYGDYDADGVCAAAILSFFLSEKGVEVFTHIPSRTGEGYGLSVKSIEHIIDECLPDLIVTCDCGISAIAEVDYTLDLGVDIIVTDHHEVGESLPRCPVVNPHRDDNDYPFRYLCGAGVALKLVEAVDGRESAMRFLELAAVATIADLVPLLDENRLIVQLGLTTTEELTNIGLKQLMESQGVKGRILSSDIAFKIAPRINAAGRMGDAYRAFSLLICDDKNKADAIVAEIENENLKRKELCAKLYDEALSDLKEENIVDNRAIILCHPNWEKGITGIVAAKLSGEFCRPSFVLVKSGDAYKGTARSVEGVNLYELLSNVSDVLVEYGGHAQAAGFSILPDRVEEFKQRVNKYLSSFPEQLFMPQMLYDLELNEEEVTSDLVMSLDKLEPFGNSNNKPIFKLNCHIAEVSSCKNNSVHTKILTQNKLQIFAFNNTGKDNLLAGNGLKSLAIELKTGFGGYEKSVKGILRGVESGELFVDNNVAIANFIKNSLLSDTESVFERYRESELDELIGSNIFGTLIVAASEQSYRNFLKTHPHSHCVLHEFMSSTYLNNYSRIVVAPQFDSDFFLSGYEKIIFLDTPLLNGIIAYLNKKTKAKIYVPEESNAKYLFEGISLDRNVFVMYYDIIRKNRIKSPNIWAYCKAVGANVKDFDLKQFVICFSIFYELGLVTLDKGAFAPKLVANKKVELDTSLIFNTLRNTII